MRSKDISSENSGKRHEWAINFSSVVLALAPFSIGIYVWWFYFHHERSLSNNPADWGTFGDFVGGIANPLVAICALLWLISSVRIQREELAETRKELKAAAEAQKDTAEHHSTLRQIEDCRMFVELVVKDIDDELGAPTEPVSIRGARVITNRDGPSIENQLIESFDRDDGSFEKLVERHLGVLKSTGVRLKACNEALEVWAMLHGKTFCYGVEYYRRHLAFVAHALYKASLLDQHTAEYFMKVFAEPTVPAKQ